MRFLCEYCDYEHTSQEVVRKHELRCQKTALIRKELQGWKQPTGPIQQWPDEEIKTLLRIFKKVDKQIQQEAGDPEANLKENGVSQ